MRLEIRDSRSTRKSLVIHQEFILISVSDLHDASHAVVFTSEGSAIRAIESSSR